MKPASLVKLKINCGARFSTRLQESANMDVIEKVTIMSATSARGAGVDAPEGQNPSFLPESPQRDDAGSADSLLFACNSHCCKISPSHVSQLS
jgi:hypothetical protein